ncbi:MAG: nucleotidyl transferase AbiEii/AbiGii toxin family protein [Candidatus Coatesbacteria bacterium]
MIPADFIAEWRARTRWVTDEQVEQDLVLSRALVEIFGDPVLAGELALRGGTALHKLHFAPARRYSNDIDLVQLRAGRFGPIMTRLRERLDGWLGQPKREQGQGVRLIYRFESEIPPLVRLKLKIETNTREHMAVRGTARMPFRVDSRWWSGAAEITAFQVEELLATKLRALFQRKKGRDLYDLCVALEAGADSAAIVAIFRAYTAAGGPITRAMFERNLAGKMAQPGFTDDLPILLPPGVTFDFPRGAALVQEALLALLPGMPWKGPGGRDKPR